MRIRVAGTDPAYLESCYRFVAPGTSTRKSMHTRWWAAISDQLRRRGGLASSYQSTVSPLVLTVTTRGSVN